MKKSGHAPCFSGKREMVNIVPSTERIWGLFFRSARSLSKTAPKSSLGLVSFTSMILPGPDCQEHMLFRKAGNPGEMVNIVPSTERIWGLFFRSARSLSKTAPKSSLSLVSFTNMSLSLYMQAFSESGKSGRNGEYQKSKT